MTLTIADGTRVGTLTKYVLSCLSLCWCPSHHLGLTSFSPPKMASVSTLLSQKLQTCYLVASSLSSIFSCFFCLPVSLSPSAKRCNILFIHVWSQNEVNRSFREMKWLPLSSSKACSSSLYPSSYPGGVVGLDFWKLPKSPCEDDEKHLVLSVWHPGEEMNLVLWHGQQNNGRSDYGKHFKVMFDLLQLSNQLIEPSLAN